MKLWSITLITFFISLSLKGQIEKEHTFNNNTTSYFQVDENEGYFSVLDRQTARLYNTDYSLYKQITLPSITDSKPLFISRLSKNLFDENPGDLEFIVGYQDTTKYNMSFAIVRENGNTVQQFDGLFGKIIEVNGTPKLTLILDNQTEVYSLPGELTNAPNPGKRTQVDEVELYPNPADEQIQLHYELKGNQSAQIKIYDVTGRIQEQLKAGPDFNHIKLDVSGYQPGTYFYQIAVNTQILDRGKFVVID